MKTTTQTILENLIEKVTKEKVNLEHPADSKFGDYSTNVAMVVAKKEKKNPREVAEEIIKKIDLKNNELVEKVEIAGAGFINFFLKKDYLYKRAEEINFDIEYKNRLGEYNRDKTVVIDYSAPNIAKPFGIGHLRSTNIGQAVYNLYKILGWKCVGDNHLGDWGTQFGKLIFAIKTWWEKKTDELTINDLEKLYIKFHAEAEKEPKLIDEGREWFSKLEKGDKEARKIWQDCVDISRREFDRVYEILGVKIDYAHGESFYESMLAEITAEMKKKKITKESQGATIVEFDKLPSAMVAKTNETTTYFTRDMATVKYRKDTWNPDLVIYEVGADQQLHFSQVFETAKMMGWEPKLGFVHLAHGLIRNKEGKFSTRAGKTIHLEEVIERAREGAIKMAESTTVAKEMNATEKQKMVEEVAIGAIKFNDLSQDPKKDIIFDWDRIMSLSGDSGPYLQYTYARAMSVLRKTKVREQNDVTNLPLDIEAEEMALLRSFYLFEEKIIEAAGGFNPSILANYLLSMARMYNEFYAKHKIVGAESEVWRIFLTRTTASVLSLGLELLGIKTVEKM